VILEAGERGKLLRILKLLHDKNETKSVYSQMKIISSRKKKKTKSWVGLFTAVFCKIKRESLFSRELTFFFDHR